MRIYGTYFQFSDGFEFILPIPLQEVHVTLKFMATSIYDFAAQEWKKYGITVYDSDYVQYQWRSAEMESRRQTFDNVIELSYEGLRKRGYLMQRIGCSAYVLNKTVYSKRLSAFIEKVKQLSTTINLGVDEGLKAQMEEMEEREAIQRSIDERELDTRIDAEFEARRNKVYIPPRAIGRTYIQLPDGKQFVINRPHELISDLLKIYAISIYDLVENQWIKYRLTVYEENGKLYSKVITDEKDRVVDISKVSIVTYPDLAREGYMIDEGEGNMSRFRFDPVALKRKQVEANIQNAYVAGKVK